MSMPTVFVSHGSPMLILEEHRPARAFLASLASVLPKRPKAIVAVSAHWETDVPAVSTTRKPSTIHDFYGFPPALYALSYGPPGAPELAEQVARLTGAAHDPHRGLDHGAWVPLRLMFPDAQIPVIPLSLQSRGGPQQAWQLGRALAPLVERGFLVVASGNITHNLRDFQRAYAGGGTPAYVREFADWLDAQLAAGNRDALLDYRRRAPGAVQAQPTEEHLLPLFVALGAAGDDAQVERFHAGIDDYVLAMDAYQFLPKSRA